MGVGPKRQSASLTSLISSLACCSLSGLLVNCSLASASRFLCSSSWLSCHFCHVLMRWSNTPCAHTDTHTHTNASREMDVIVGLDIILVNNSWYITVCLYFPIVNLVSRCCFMSWNTKATNFPMWDNKVLLNFEYFIGQYLHRLLPNIYFQNNFSINTENLKLNLLCPSIIIKSKNDFSVH